MIESQRFEQLYRMLVRYFKKRSDRRSCPEELSQEVLARLWCKREEFKAQSTVKTFVIAIAKRVLLEEKRRLDRQNRVYNQVFDLRIDPAQVEFCPYEQTCRAEAVTKVRTAVSNLNANQKQALTLFYIEGKSLKETAIKTKCSIKGVDSRLRRARQSLTRLLPQEI
jgi:RNA polymerase sigma-70 factor, ECF subfamily